MLRYTLLLLEVTGIQNYIFGSNQLAQNIGASELVLRVTTEWMLDTLKALKLESNIQNWDQVRGLQYLPSKTLQSGLDVEVIYGGGGNAMLLFADDNKAGQFVRLLSRRVVADAPGLQLVVIRDMFEWDEAILADIHQTLRGELASRKSNRISSTPLLGLGVTAACDFTGQPAVGFDQDPALVGDDAVEKARQTAAQPRLISAEVAAKIGMEAAGKDRLKATLEGFMPDEFDFVYNFDEFGTPGESSYIAVVHADANQMSKRFDTLAAKHGKPEQNGDYILALRKLSLAIQERGQTALQNTVVQLLRSRDDEGKFGGKVAPPIRNKRLLLPFRPIVFGGDDTTFVCDGRLGLSLAVNYLQEWEQNPLDGEQTYARAGVAIVKSHYPFARAYNLADELIASAKDAVLGRKTDAEAGVTVLDWHFSTTGINHPLAKLRGLEYSSHGGNSLLMRPVRVTPGGNTWRSWKTLRHLIKKFQEEQEWSGRRNKVIALREALRGDATAVHSFRLNYRIEQLPKIPGQPEMPTSGWQGADCGYYDAIEAIDFFVPLDSNLEEVEA